MEHSSFLQAFTDTWSNLTFQGASTPPPPHPRPSPWGLLPPSVGVSLAGTCSQAYMLLCVHTHNHYVCMHACCVWRALLVLFYQCPPHGGNQVLSTFGQWKEAGTLSIPSGRPARVVEAEQIQVWVISCWCILGCGV